MNDGFGPFLRKLIEARFPTLDDAARAMGVSDQTLWRGLTSKTCPWRTTTRNDVIAAMHDVSPLADSDLDQFMRFSGASGDGIASMRHQMKKLREHRQAIEKAVSGTRADADLHNLIDDLQEEFTTQLVRQQLQAMAASIRATAAAVKKGPVVKIDRGDGVKEVLGARPVTPPAKQRRKSS